MMFYYSLKLIFRVYLAIICLSSPNWTQCRSTWAHAGSDFLGRQRNNLKNREKLSNLKFFLKFIDKKIYLVDFFCLWVSRQSKAERRWVPQVDLLARLALFLAPRAQNQSEKGERVRLSNVRNDGIEFSEITRFSYLTFFFVKNEGIELWAVNTPTLSQFVLAFGQG